MKREIDIPSILFREGESAALAAIEGVADWGVNEASCLLIRLASIGYSRWPTKLVSLGADINFVGDEGETALSQCVHGEKRNKHQTADPTFQTAIECLSLGADPNLPYLGWRPLLGLTLSCNRPEFAVLFLCFGANFTEELRREFYSSSETWARELLAIYEKRHGRWT